MSELPDQLREFLRALRADLTEKRLLPLVVVLAAAAIGIPIAFSMSSSGSSGTQVPPVAPTGPGAAVAAVPPAQQSKSTARPLGRLHDPFAGSASATKAAATSKLSSPITAKPPTPTTGGSGTSTTPKPVSSGTTGPGGATGTSPGTSLKPPLSQVSKRALTVYSVDFSFGQGVSVKTINNALRLDASPANTAPVAQYLGVTRSGLEAAFLIWGPATASGDGHCVDGQTPCQIVELKPGDTEFIDVQVPSAGIVQFELDMRAIHSEQAATAAEALKAHMLQSTDGVKLLSLSNASALAKFEYSTVYGTLLPRPTQTSGTQQASSTHGANSAARPSAGLGSHRVRHHAHRGRH